MEIESETAVQIQASDGHKIFLRHWKTEQKEAPALIVSHGMAEHSERYARFAKFLNKIGISVFAHDHRGHGKSLGKDEPHGKLGDRDGWQNLIDDIDQVYKHARSEGHSKVFVMGHSMGSMAALTYARQHGEKLSGLILSSPPKNAGALGSVGKIVANTITKIGAPHAPSKIMNYAVFGAFNAKVKSPKSVFDWLTRDQAEVQKYIDDPLCGEVFGAEFFKQFIGAILKNFNGLSDLPKTLPVLMIAGTKDPVVGYKTGIAATQKALANAVEDFTLETFEDARHELLNETNRAEVMEVLAKWITKTT